jgi:hypothetical protein
MKPLTEIEALTQTALLWKWLAEDPKWEKNEYPGFADWGEDVAAHCFLCEYVERQPSIKDCRSCPLWQKWDGYPVCRSLGSPYDVWLDSKGKKRQRAAALIASLCRKELARLEGGSDG